MADSTQTAAEASQAAAQASKAGDIAGGAVGYATATLAYKAFNGLLPKAQLFVPKTSSDAELNDAAAALTGSNDVAALKKLVQKKKTVAKSNVASGFAGRLKQAAGVMPVIGTLATGVVQGGEMTGMMAQNNYSVLEVQYNPKSISIGGNSGKMLRRNQSGDVATQQLGFTSKISRLQLSCELIFEDIVVADAFHLEGLSMNAEELANTAKSMITNTFLGGYSVQRQCDGLVALLNYKRLKQVVFLWGDMFFHGELTNVDVRYEMFNKQGNPILGRVRIVIEQNDSDNSIRFQSDEQQWNDAIDIAFGPGLL